VTASALVAAVGRARARSIKELCEQPFFADFDIFEPGISGAHRKFMKELPRYHQSVYFKESASQEGTQVIAHQDLMALSFADESFDVVITSDIFEHIRDPFAAFSEIQRVLRRGGVHVFSIPALVKMPLTTVPRVDTTTDTDVLLMEAVYHGDGAGGRSLVYTDFGADFLDRLSEIGLRTICITNDHLDTTRARLVAFVSVRL
jgi:SAM-dependent methyltransferase